LLVYPSARHVVTSFRRGSLTQCIGLFVRGLVANLIPAPGLLVTYRSEGVGVEG
jgi:hypothetical protein